jgi:hypothetical protein
MCVYLDEHTQHIIFMSTFNSTHIKVASAQNLFIPFSELNYSGTPTVSTLSAFFF